MSDIKSTSDDNSVTNKEHRESWYNRITNSIKQHFGFSLTIVVTYSIGILLTFIQFEVKSSSSEDVNLSKLLIDTIVPTTITYVLGCVLVNIVELFENKSNNYVYNILTCIFIMLYTLVFCLYIISEFSNFWIVTECVLTAIILFFNCGCYFEKRKKSDIV